MRWSIFTAFSLCALSLSALSPAAEDQESPVEADPGEPPPSDQAAPPTAAPPPAAPPPAAPPPADPRTLSGAAPGAQPAPYWGAPAAVAPAAPPQADRAPEREPEIEEPEVVIPRWQVALGVRTAFVTNEGFDPFSGDNRMMQFSLGGSRTLYEQGAFSIAAAAHYDVSTHDSSVRGEATELSTHRLALGPEFRAHLFPIFYAFARPAPAAVRTIARLDESTTGTSLYARSWTFGFDATAGAAVRAIAFGRGVNAVRLWVIGEGGYGWSSSSDLRLAPDEDDAAAPQRVSDVDLGMLALRGPMFRIMVAATF